MNKPESILENEIHKILWDFAIQTDHLIPTRRSDLVLKDRQILGSSERTKIAEEHESDSDTSCWWCTWNGSKF